MARGNLTATDIAARCEALGARVAPTGRGKIKIIPPDPTKQIVFIADRFSNGSDRENALGHLRSKAGLDVTAPAPEETPVPTPADLPRRSPNVTPIAQPPATAPSAVDELLGMLAEAEARIRELELGAAGLLARVARLEEGGVRPRTRAEVMRGVVLAFFESHRGTKWSPELVRLNLEDEGRLPEDARPESVAAACKDLATAGKIQGGGSNSKGKSGPSGTRGIYWLDPE